MICAASQLARAEVILKNSEKSYRGEVIGEVLEFGLLKLQGNEKRHANSTTPGRQIIEAPDGEFTHYTDVVEAVVGSRFGFRFAIYNLPDKAEVVLRTVVRHPLLLLPSGGSQDHYEIETRLPIFYGTATGISGYGLDTVFESVPGDWTFEHWLGEKLVVAQSFKTLSPQAASDWRDAIEKRLAAIQNLPALRNGSPPTVEQAIAMAQFSPSKYLDSILYSNAGPGDAVQTQRRMSSFWRGRAHYSFTARDGPLWEALFRDETASIYGRMIAAGYLLEAGTPGAKEFLELQLNSFYRRYVHNAVTVVMSASGKQPEDSWIEERLLDAIHDERLFNRFNSSDAIPDDWQLYVEDDQLDLMVSTFDSVCWRLGHLKSRKAVPVLLHWVDACPNQHGRAPIQALGEIGDASAAPILMKHLKSEEPRKPELIEALGKLHHRPAIPLLIEHLNAGMNSDPPKSSGAQEALKALLAMYAKEAIPVISAWANHKDVHHQPLARRVLAHLENQDPVPALIGLLKSERNERDKREVIKDLAASRSRRAFDEIRNTAVTSPDAFTRAIAIRGLGAIGSNESLHTLVELSHEPLSQLQTFLGRTLKDSIVEALEEATGQKCQDDFKAWEKWLYQHQEFPPMID